MFKPRLGGDGSHDPSANKLCGLNLDLDFMLLAKHCYKLEKLPHKIECCHNPRFAPV